ncbi:hypothetical protein ACVWZL_007353 [Bradyrhizobium sp. GM2.4]
MNESTDENRRTAKIERGIHEIREEAKRLLEEETGPGGMFYGLKLAAHIEPERVEELLTMTRRGGDLIKAKVRAMKEYGEDVL